MGPIPMCLYRMVSAYPNGDSIMSQKFNTVSDIPDKGPWELVTGSHEKAHIIRHIGKDPEDYAHMGLFVKVENADYTEVWAFSGNVPYLYKRVSRVI
jgi:hypothetical protein